jgi:membrane-bound lytic murein transglycosylase MltF
MGACAGYAVPRLIVLVLALLISSSTALAQSTLPADKNAMALPIYPSYTGDFDQMRKARLVRILVPYSKTIYFIDQGYALGTAADLGRAFGSWLNWKYRTGSIKIQIAFIPTPLDQLLPALIAGRGDVVAGSLDVTPERLQAVDFAIPWLKGVKEFVVTGPATPALATIDNLACRQILVRRSSSYYTHLVALNQIFKAMGLKEIKIIPADENLSDEDLLEMVNAGLLRIAIVDGYKAFLWEKILDNIRVRTDLILDNGGDVAWAIRKNSPLLMSEINQFVATHGINTNFGAEVKWKYYDNTKIVKNAYSANDQATYKRLIAYFKKYAGQYGFDYLMVVAQGYQESRLRQSAHSPYGAVGVMQMLPSTAASPRIDIVGIGESEQRNIEAGTKYLRLLEDTYLSDPTINQTNKTLMAFAAYNAGPGNLERFRDWAKRSGLDPNVWFYNVELGAARIVGQQTVTYVSHIYKYYVAYRLLAEQEAQAAQLGAPAALAP